MFALLIVAGFSFAISSGSLDSLFSSEDGKTPASSSSASQEAEQSQEADSSEEAEPSQEAEPSEGALPKEDSTEDGGEENGVQIGGGADSDGGASQYESVISDYREALNSSTQPQSEMVNPLAWEARDYNKGKFAYALYDINGDGAEELLVGTEESDPVAHADVIAYYELYDLFTIENSVPVRVLDDNHMGSLGYRGFCVPCENGFLATGGSGGATNYTLEYWRLGDKATEKTLSDSVVMDGDVYTFTDGNGYSEILVGDEAQAKYANELIPKYTPITHFAWHLL